MGFPEKIMGIALPAFCNFNPKKVQIGLAVSTVVMLVVLIICFATFGWVVDHTTASCDTSLSESKCSGFGTVDLTGDAKDEGRTMAGLGAMCFIFLFLDLIVLVILLLGKFATHNKIFLIAGLACTGLAWLFLTAGWGRFADSKGGFDDSPDYGASFGFTVIVWLYLFPYAFFWFWLFNAGNDAQSDSAQAAHDGEPNNDAYSGEPASYTVNNGGTVASQPSDPASTQSVGPDGIVPIPPPPVSKPDETQA